MKKKSVPFLWGLAGGVLIGTCLGAGILSLRKGLRSTPADESEDTKGEPGRTPGQAEGERQEGT